VIGSITGKIKYRKMQKKYKKNTKKYKKNAKKMAKKVHTCDDMFLLFGK
jgi:ABC-type Zn uptake system ZnuABC Zn-binding protein ZnuA